MVITKNFIKGIINIQITAKVANRLVKLAADNKIVIN
jgi:hypothetical protein